MPAVSLPSAAARRFHVEIAEALVAENADPALIVHHAERAGLDDVVADHALVAARRAAALKLQSPGLLPLPPRLGLRRPARTSGARRMLEEFAEAAYHVNRLDEAFEAIDGAIRIHREVGDAEGVGRCTRIFSRLHWFAGDGDIAWEKALEAIEILEPLGESAELARAYSGFSQHAMLAQDTGQALIARFRSTYWRQHLTAHGPANDLLRAYQDQHRLPDRFAEILTEATDYARLVDPGKPANQRRPRHPDHPRPPPQPPPWPSSKSSATTTPGTSSPSPAPPSPQPPPSFTTPYGRLVLGSLRGTKRK